MMHATQRFRELRYHWPERQWYRLTPVGAIAVDDSYVAPILKALGMPPDAKLDLRETQGSNRHNRYTDQGGPP